METLQTNLNGQDILKILHSVNIYNNTPIPTYMVVIGNYVYEMNKNADLPNGVCIFSGNKCGHVFKTIPDNDYLSLGMMRKIAEIVISDPMMHLTTE